MASIAKQRLNRIESKRQALSISPVPSNLYDFYKWANDGEHNQSLIDSGKDALEPPRHLTQVVDVMHKIGKEPIRVVFNTPPQHGKTELILHCIVWLLLTRRHFEIAYVTYSVDQAAAVALRARDIAKRVGLIIENDAIGHWVLSGGRSVLFTGIEGPITGRPFDAIFVDDPFKNATDARSKKRRDSVYEFVRQVVIPRDKGMLCTFLQHTRWHVDDVSGRLIKNDGWQPINQKAIQDDGTVLWDKRPLELLERIRKGNERAFASQYQGMPVEDGDAVFEQPVICDITDVPSWGRGASGVDLAYSSKTAADYSVILVMIENGGKYYIKEVARRQCPAEVFEGVINDVNDRHGTSSTWHASGTEQGTASFLKKNGVRLNVVTAKSDKLTRALPVSVAWNSGKVLVPRGQPWTNAFIDEVTSFTGVGDAHDDQVDALASAFSALERMPTRLPEARGQRMAASAKKYY